MFHVREFAQPVATQKRFAFWSIAAWPLRVLAARQALSQLGSMDDRELADVGLCRQDLRDATALGPWDDPTEMFAERARERHLRQGHARPRRSGRAGSSMGTLPSTAAERS